MAKADLALITQTGMVMDKEKLKSVMAEVVAGAPKDAVMLRFTIKPLDVAAEVNAVMDRLSGLAVTNECNGQVGGEELMRVAEA